MKKTTIDQLAEEHPASVLWRALEVRWSEQRKLNNTVSDSLLEDIVKYYGEDAVYKVLFKNTKLGKVLA